MKKALILALVLCSAFTFTACKSAKKDNGQTASISSEEGMIAVDTTAKDDKTVASEAAKYEADMGYKFEKSEKTIANEGIEADGYLLNNDKTSSTIASVYIEQGEDGYIEMDVELKDTSDDDIQSSINMVREMVSKSLPGFPIDEIDGTIPLSLKTVKALIAKGEDASETVYGTDTATAFSFDYMTRSQVIIYRIELG